MYVVKTERGRTVRAYEDHEAAVGYLVSYVACAGGACVMLAPDDASKTSLFARRDGWKVSVEVFGSALEAIRRIQDETFAPMRAQHARNLARLEGRTV